MMIRYRPYFIFCLIVALGWLLFHKHVSKTYFIPFDEAQTLNHNSPKELIDFYQHLRRKKWKVAQHLYQTHIAGKQKLRKKGRIPKVIHQIWLEGPIPPSIEKVQNTWKKYHPNWEYHLWTHEEVNFLYLQNRKLYDETTSLKKKCEILRYEILGQFGGLFVESDIECLKPFDILNDNLDFYAGITDQIKTPLISTALIATIPNHPIMRRCIRALRDECPILGPTFLTICFYASVKKRGPLATVLMPAIYFDFTPKELSTSPTEAPPNKSTFASRKRDLSVEINSQND